LYYFFVLSFVQFTLLIILPIFTGLSKKKYIYYWVTQILSLQVLATALQIFPKVQKNLFVQCFEQIISKRIMIFEQIS